MAVVALVPYLALEGVDVLERLACGLHRDKGGVAGDGAVERVAVAGVAREQYAGSGVEQHHGAGGVAGGAHGGDDSAAQVKGLAVHQVVAHRVGACGPGADVGVHVVGIGLARALGDEACIVLAELHAVHGILAHVGLVHVILVEPAQTADVVAVGVGNKEHDGLIRDACDDGAQVADAGAGIDDHGLLLALQHEDGAAVELVDLPGVLGDLDDGKRSGCHNCHPPCVCVKCNRFLTNIVLLPADFVKAREYAQKSNFFVVLTHPNALHHKYSMLYFFITSEPLAHVIMLRF